MDITTKSRPYIAQEALLAPRRWRENELAHIGASASELVWSPDGRYAAYVLTESKEIAGASLFSLCCIRADGRGASILCYGYERPNQARPVYREPKVACWSPDGRSILFWKLYPHTGSANLDGAPLYQIDLRGGSPRLLTTPFGSFGDNCMIWYENPPRFSPDGRYLLLIVGSDRFMVTNKRLALIAYPNGRRSLLTGPNWAISEAAWSPDGRHIAVAMTPDHGTLCDSNDISYRSSRSHIWLMNADGNGKRQITGDPRFRESHIEWLPPARSGNLHLSLRFVRFDNADLGPKVRWESLRSQWEIRADGTGLRKLRDLPPLPLN